MVKINCSCIVKSGDNIDLKSVKVDARGRFYLSGAGLQPQLLHSPVPNKYFTSRRVGSGTYGFVYRHSYGDMNFISKKFTNDEDLAQEVALIEYLNKMPGGKGQCTVESFILKAGNKTYLLMEDMDGSLSDLLRICRSSGEALSEVVVFEIILEIFKQLLCLEKIGLIYTDIKLANILYKCEQGNNIKIRVGDLGSLAPSVNNTDEELLEKFYESNSCIEGLETKEMCEQLDECFWYEYLGKCISKTYAIATYPPPEFCVKGLRTAIDFAGSIIPSKVSILWGLGILALLLKDVSNYDILKLYTNSQTDSAPFNQCFKLGPEAYKTMLERNSKKIIDDHFYNSDIRKIVSQMLSFNPMDRGEAWSELEKLVT